MTTCIQVKNVIIAKWHMLLFSDGECLNDTISQITRTGAHPQSSPIRVVIDSGLQNH